MGSHPESHPTLSPNHPSPKASVISHINQPKFFLISVVQKWNKKKTPTKKAFLSHPELPGPSRPHRPRVWVYFDAVGMHRKTAGDQDASTSHTSHLGDKTKVILWGFPSPAHHAGEWLGDREKMCKKKQAVLRHFEGCFHIFYLNVDVSQNGSLRNCLAFSYSKSSVVAVEENGLKDSLKSVSNSLFLGSHKPTVEFPRSFQPSNFSCPN